jgi:coenzyme F420-0:L-glutamate ligase / coenzyme F420-1:gamma-L-glutamate ligase
MAKRKSSAGSESTATKDPPWLQLVALPGLPEIRRGDLLSRLITQAAQRSKISFHSGDVLVVAQKIVSKAEGHVVSLTDVQATPRAQRLAAKLKRMRAS